ncbi:Protein CBG26006 [Caenorhabditis briggsae]|uniref:Protein CBG26006 n=1 Tax=Caenorhabditis briggsae TaxID=6238 RepID=B6IKV6_CAEBR|nr:Protein CBG26006 [Caenorhabditis briggsae]CAS00536.1 Protein CBG26006 [Caenorhabditis briggsae]
MKKKQDPKMKSKGLMGEEKNEKKEGKNYSKIHRKEGKKGEVFC